MRLFHQTLRWTGTVLCATALLGASGCGLVGGSMLAGWGMAKESDSATKDADAAAHAAQVQANRLAGAISHDVPATGLPAVRWADEAAASGSTGANTPSGATAAASSAALGAAAPAPVRAAAPATPASERGTLISQMREVIRSSNDPGLIRALSAVLVTATEPGQTLSPADVAGLDDGRRALVMSFYKAVQALPPPPGPAANPETVVAVGDGVAAASRPAALKVRTLQLCRRVRSFGVYDTFEGTTFLAGRDQKVVVYVELDNFKSVRNAQGIYEVKLTQDVQLYNDADGLKVWSEPAVDISDQSRNQRRDFFMVETVQLPARLSVGKYEMKVRVRDRQGDCVDEAAVPVNIVADPTLLSGVPTER